MIARVRGDFGLDSVGIQIIGNGINIHKDRFGTSISHTALVAKNVKVGKMTSSPGPISMPCRARDRASVPEPQPMP
jgi:hypothetical protein